MQTIITKSSQETQKLGEELAKKMKGGEMVCLTGELGSGKTTFTQGFLKELGAKGPHTSPTFLIMKQYLLQLKTKNEKLKTIENIYHIDAYRVNGRDILNLGWEEIIANKKNITIIEWAERIKNIIPKNAHWVRFEWAGEKERKIAFES